MKADTLFLFWIADSLFALCSVTGGGYWGQNSPRGREGPRLARLEGISFSHRPLNSEYSRTDGTLASQTTCPPAAIQVCNVVLPLNKARQNVFIPKMMETWNKINAVSPNKAASTVKQIALMELSYVVTKSKVLSIRRWCDKYHICYETMRVSVLVTARLKHDVSNIALTAMSRLWARY